MAMSIVRVLADDELVELDVGGEDDPLTPPAGLTVA
jgi:hypothetical protein